MNTVQHTTDQTKLARFAVEAEDWKVRKAAVEKLTDQALLAKIAMEAKWSTVSFAAVKKVTDQVLLAKIAVEDEDWKVRKAAVEKLTDQVLLAKIAVEDKWADVRIAAMDRLTDQAVLAKIAVEDKWTGVRIAAMDRLADLTLLAKIAVEDKIEGGDIVDLLRLKMIEIQTQGSGIKSVVVGMRKLVRYPITVRVPVGSYFVSSRQSAQNMVTTSEITVRLTGDDWRRVSVPAACANRQRGIPSSHDTFTVKRSLHQPELARLMPILNKAGVPYAVRQAAVWIVTDNADYDDLGILVSRSQWQVFGGTRQIWEYESAKAMKICDEAGIDITRKAIWRDWEEIMSGLEDEVLKKWLKAK